MNALAVVRRSAGALAALAALAVVWWFSPSHAGDALGTIALSTREMLVILPPVFVFLGLLDVWVPREYLVRYMGENSGVRGTGIAFILGSFAAGPLYAAFPVATVLMRKGCSAFNVIVFVGAWSTTKVPMFLFEYGALGGPFALTRLAVNIPAILLIAAAISRLAPPRPGLSGTDG